MMPRSHGDYYRGDKVPSPIHDDYVSVDDNFRRQIGAASRSPYATGAGFINCHSIVHTTAYGDCLSCMMAAFHGRSA